MVNVAPRIVNAILGVWLFISAFLWPHTHVQFTKTWVCGVLCVAFALLAMALPQARYLNTLLAIWLFISAWALPSMSIGTIWCNVLTSIAIFVVSLVPSAPTDRPVGFIDRNAPPRPV
jgi:hypothetical protein